MKRTILLLLVCLAVKTAWTQQTVTLDEALQAIASNNRELKMNTHRSSALRAEYAAVNTLPDPKISYTRQYGNKEGLGINGELLASQSFDFPWLYVQRNKLTGMKTQGLALQQDRLCRQILLRAQEVCLDLILLRQERTLLGERLANARQVEQLYARRLETGDANRIETNKIGLELLNVKTDYRRNALAIDEKLKELENLNGGLPLPFESDAYEPVPALPAFEALCNEALALDPALKALQGERNVATQAWKLSRAGWLPGLEAGYQLNTATRGERFSGFLVGLSFPLFSNRPRVRQARAETLHAELMYEDSAMRTENELVRLYGQALALDESLGEYRRLLEGQGTPALLNKALDTGAISLIDYFVATASLYEGLRNCMKLENDYRKTLARLLQHRLSESYRAKR
ncbi:MAG: TolC family protein [Tannerellaceae bacterium]|nr:TolC family protein [Tannerellaceae bacterium]